MAIMEQEELGPYTLCVLDESRDSRTTWEPSNPALVEKAKMRFEELKGQGYLAYKISLAYKSNKGASDGGDGEVITSFDPTAERIVMHRALVGG